MILDLEMLNDDAALNNFFVINSAQFVQGQPLRLVMRMKQPQKNGLRYVTATGATFSIDFKLSDGNTLNKVPTVLDAGDRSIVQVDLTGAETTLLVGQDLTLNIDEAGATSIATLQMALQAVKTSGC